MVERRYFVTVKADSRRALRNLSEEDLDLFQATAKEADDGTYSIEGLLTLEQVARLVEADYQVLVQEESSKRARAGRETIEFTQWLREMDT